ncbi:MAG TPA: FIST N-terminal domain-containing protein [Elusimicrobiota bacterium]|nr:FIST N-terminal domain-containing protein [Elusimicrobiota bacterium]
MKWISSLSTASTLPQALTETIRAVKESLGRSPDLCLVFASSEFLAGYETIVPRLQAELGPRVILGCSGGGVLGEGREVEHRPALTLTAAILPGVTLTPFRLADSSLPGLDVSPREWHSLVGVAPRDQPQFILLADPFSIRTENFIMGLDYAYPKSVKVGGLASGATQPGENALFLNSVCYRSGAVGLALTGNIAMDVLVAQGCRPIGRPLRVTKCDRNILMELDGQPPLNLLRDLYTTLDERDQHLLQNALFLGLVMDPLKSHFTQGDFLIRNIVGLDADKGILAVGALLRQGQLVQFHLRDAQTSADDLHHILSAYRSRPARDHVAATLLFSCLGRGEYLYGSKSHDSRKFQEKIGSIPMGGFFCNGEIGPVGGTTYLHGYTSCFAMLRPLYVPATDAVINAAAAQPAHRPPAF